MSVLAPTVPNQGGGTGMTGTLLVAWLMACKTMKNK